MSYRMEVEIFEGKGGELRKEDGKILMPDLAQEGICAWMYRGDGKQSYRIGQRFVYPDEMGNLCPWLLDSLQGMARILQTGGTLFWTYENTLYRKEIDPQGVTTEFARCPDPSASGIVVKIIRTKLPD